MDRRALRRARSDLVQRGDVYLVALDPTSGREQQGRRPVLIISADAFNAATGVPVVLPITNGGNFARRRGFAVALAGGATTGVVRCDQPRALDIAARGGRKVDEVGAEVMEDVLARVAVIFG